jgi:hypothetical protein
VARPKLVLHPGTHHTGTTAIQESLSRNRSWLAARKVAYPQLHLAGERGPKSSHHAMAKALASEGPDVSQEVQHYRGEIERAADSARLTVLSTESIYRHMLGKHGEKAEVFFAGHTAYLERLRHFLQDFDVSVLIYFRRPDQIAESRFKSLIARGLRTSSFAEESERMPWFYDYPRRIALFGDIFDSVVPRRYADEARKGLLTGVYAALDLEDSPPEGAGAVRVSHGNRATLWLRRALEDDASPQLHQHRALFAAEHAKDPLFAEPEPSTLWPSEAVFAAFVERHRSAYEMGYFDTPEPPARPATVWTDAMHAAACEAFARWEGVNAERLLRRDAKKLKYWDPDLL